MLCTEPIKHGMKIRQLGGGSVFTLQERFASDVSKAYILRAVTSSSAIESNLSVDEVENRLKNKSKRVTMQIIVCSASRPSGNTQWRTGC